MQHAIDQAAAAVEVVRRESELLHSVGDSLDAVLLSSLATVGANGIGSDNPNLIASESCNCNHSPAGAPTSDNAFCSSLIIRRVGYPCHKNHHTDDPGHILFAFHTSVDAGAIYRFLHRRF
ncbi:MAG: hypothetical protein AAGI44_06630 [Pseudomonadota bacterium]